MNSLVLDSVGNSELWECGLKVLKTGTRHECNHYNYTKIIMKSSIYSRPNCLVCPGKEGSFILELCQPILIDTRCKIPCFSLCDFHSTYSFPRSKHCVDLKHTMGPLGTKQLTQWLPIKVLFDHPNCFHKPM